jgi:hypothetical protein
MTHKFKPKDAAQEMSSYHCWDLADQERIRVLESIAQSKTSSNAREIVTPLGIMARSGFGHLMEQATYVIMRKYPHCHDCQKQLPMESNGQSEEQPP